MGSRPLIVSADFPGVYTGLALQRNNFVCNLSPTPVGGQIQSGTGNRSAGPSVRHCILRCIERWICEKTTSKLCAWIAVLTLCTFASVGQQSPSMKTMALDADPSFEAATIKPNGSGVGTLLGIKMAGRSFTTLNCVAGRSDRIRLRGAGAGRSYEAPKWATEDRYDLSGVADADGIPNVLQQRTMVRKLLADRVQADVPQRET